MEITLKKCENGWIIMIGGKTYLAAHNWRVICKVLKPIMLTKEKTEINKVSIRQN